MNILANLIKEAVDKYSSQIFIIERDIYRRKTYTYNELYNRAISICNYFLKSKIVKGDKVVIYFSNSSDYVALLWACAISGVIAVPLDFNSPIEFAEKIYKKVGAKKIFCSVFKKLAGCNCFFVEEMSTLYEKFESNSFMKECISEKDVFEIVFTSGTTSDPKGVVLTNVNLYSNIIAMRKMITFNLKHQSILSLLPLSHLFEQTAGFFCPIDQGVSIVYIQSRKPTMIIRAIKEEKIKSMITVPLFLETMKKRIEFEAEKIGKLNSFKYNLQKYSKYPSLIKKMIFRRIRKNFPNLEYFFVGGAELSSDVEKFWNDLGIIVLQGYGLTEASPVVSCNSPLVRKFGSVGKPLQGVEVKIENGEILVSGKNVFGEYYEDTKKTTETIKNNWLYTGDLGTFDDNGFLKITGRKKNMIISPSGLNVYPEDIERVITGFTEIKESVVMGLENGKKIVAVVILKKLLDKKSLSNLLERINSKLQSHQLLSELLVWPEQDFPKTTTMKIKRGLVEETIVHHKKITKEFSVEANDRLINLISIICQKDISQIKENSVLANIGLDSIRRIELAVKIEEVFNIDFNESGINEKSTVKDLRKMISSSENFKVESGISFLNSSFFNFVRIPLQGVMNLFSKSIYRLEVKGKENFDLIKKEQPLIFVCNHVSMFDTFTIYRALPISIRIKTFSAAARDFFFKNYITAVFGRLAYNAFAFSRKENVKQSLIDFGEIISEGNNVLIYPEGTRSRNGQLLEFKTGTGLMVWNTGVSVVPIKINGLYDVLPVGKIFPKFGRRIEIIFGKPLKFTKMQSPQEITEKLHEAVKNLK